MWCGVPYSPFNPYPFPLLYSPIYPFPTQPHHPSLPLPHTIPNHFSLSNNPSILTSSYLSLPLQQTPLFLPSLLLITSYSHFYSYPILPANSSFQPYSSMYPFPTPLSIPSPFPFPLPTLPSIPTPSSLHTPSPISIPSFLLTPHTIHIPSPLPTLISIPTS